MSLSTFAAPHPTVVGALTISSAFSALCVVAPSPTHIVRIQDARQDGAKQMIFEQAPGSPTSSPTNASSTSFFQEDSPSSIVTHDSILAASHTIGRRRLTPRALPVNAMLPANLPVNQPQDQELSPDTPFTTDPAIAFSPPTPTTPNNPTGTETKQAPVAIVDPTTTPAAKVPPTTYLYTIEAPTTVPDSPVNVPPPPTSQPPKAFSPPASLVLLGNNPAASSPTQPAQFSNANPVAQAQSDGGEQEETSTITNQAPTSITDQNSDTTSVPPPVPTSQNPTGVPTSQVPTGPPTSQIPTAGPPTSQIPTGATSQAPAGLDTSSAKVGGLVPTQTSVEATGQGPTAVAMSPVSGVTSQAATVMEILETFTSDGVQQVATVVVTSAQSLIGDGATSELTGLNSPLSNVLTLSNGVITTLNDLNSNDATAAFTTSNPTGSAATSNGKSHTSVKSPTSTGGSSSGSLVSNSSEEDGGSSSSSIWTSKLLGAIIGGVMGFLLLISFCFVVVRRSKRENSSGGHEEERYGDNPVDYRDLGGRLESTDSLYLPLALDENGPDMSQRTSFSAIPTSRASVFAASPALSRSRHSLDLPRPYTGNTLESILPNNGSDYTVNDYESTYSHSMEADNDEHEDEGKGLVFDSESGSRRAAQEAEGGEGQDGEGPRPVWMHEVLPKRKKRGSWIS
ncbi:hypothetical protein P7C70_g4044, partial [Phenoliferia sp. Uapishka_3]